VGIGWPSGTGKVDEERLARDVCAFVGVEDRVSAVEMTGDVNS
jgi:hypothetical protein